MRSKMEIYRILFSLYCIKLATCTEAPCVIELECAECLPDNMPLVTSHRAVNGTVTVAAGEELTLSCGGGRLLAAPLVAAAAAVCEAGRYRLRHDGSLRHLLDLGCQENIFEDVLHPVEECAPPRQGRAYKMSEGAGGGRHVATLCFDADRALPEFAHACNAPANTLRLPPHDDRSAPLSLLGNFNHMFDASTRSAAEQIYSDDARTNKRLHEILKHDRVALAGHTLTAGKLLADHYFEDQNMRVAQFASNKVLTWRSVAEGNLRHAQLDVARLLRLTRARAHLHVYAGTHAVSTLRTARSRVELRLRGERFPVPKYIWTVVHDAERSRALAIIVLNEPLVAVSEIRESVFCESLCTRVGWLHELRRARRYEAPALGLAFCCGAHELAARVRELPRAALAGVPPGDGGLLTDLYT